LFLEALFLLARHFSRNLLVPAGTRKQEKDFAGTAELLVFFLSAVRFFEKRRFRCD